MLNTLVALVLAVIVTLILGSLVVWGIRGYYDYKKSIKKNHKWFERNKYLSR